MKTVFALALLISAAAAAETPYVLPQANPAPADSATPAPAPQPDREWAPMPVFTPDRGPARFVAGDRIVLEIPLR